MSSRLVSTIFFALAAMSAPADRAHATTVMPMSLADLVDGSEAIVVASWLEAKYHVTPERLPFTEHRFEVEAVLKGKADQKTLSLYFEGGPIDDGWVGIEGSPEFGKPGARCVLFIRANGRGPVPILGWAHGVLDVADRPELGGTVLLDRFGNVVTGIAKGAWTRAPLQGEGSGIKVLSTSGLEVIPDAPRAAVGRRLDSLLAELSSFIRGRSSRASHAPAGSIAEISRAEFRVSRVAVPARIVEGSK